MSCPRDSWRVYESPIGPLTLVAGRAGLAALRFPGKGGRLDQEGDTPRGLAGAVEQLEAYFAGEQTPVPIVVPCHRVIGSDGSLTGYGGGLQRKQALLDLEARVAPDPAWAFRQLALI